MQKEWNRIGADRFWSFEPSCHLVR